MYMIYWFLEFFANSMIWLCSHCFLWAHFTKSLWMGDISKSMTSESYSVLLLVNVDYSLTITFIFFMMGLPGNYVNFVIQESPCFLRWNCGQLWDLRETKLTTLANFPRGQLHCIIFCFDNDLWNVICRIQISPGEMYLY